jgi:GH25 family lysozyme M1 (1,4-beta-N-acetylmuramidase)
MAGNGSVDRLRVITANVQSFPQHALSLAEAKEDLRRNAEAGDLVLLQEIVDRYRPLVARAFPDREWEVFYGHPDNSAPIAFRRSRFRRVKGRAMQLHPPRAGIHGRRFTTYLQLALEPDGTELHVTNLHLVARAFSKPPSPQRALRVREWNEGIAKHLSFLDTLVESGQPVLGGGDYNRQLRRHASLGTEIGDRRVKYAVDPGAIDLLWFIDGERDQWTLTDKELFAGRGSANARRNSDHGARLATVALSSNGDAPQGIAFTPVNGVHHGSPDGPNQDQNQGQNQGQNGGQPAEGHRVMKPKDPPRPEREWPDAFKKTKFGHPVPHTVDWKTRAALEQAEDLLGYRLSLTQGSYSTNVEASAHTHDRGGVVDLKSWDAKRKIKVLRSLGFAAWHRLPSQGPWPEHIHAVLIEHGNLHPQAKAQVEDYRKGLDGLKGDAKDPTPRPKPIPIFKYPPAGPPRGDKQDRPRPKPDSGDDPVVEPLGSAYPPRRSFDGVDTSHHQAGKLDLRRAQHAGLRWWYVKATEGETHIDDTYHQRIREARAAGVPVGSYHFARPDGGDAVKEAKHFLENTEIKAGDMQPMLDLEGRQVLKRAELTRWVGVWVTTVRGELAERGLVARPIIYTRFDLDDAFGCLLWVARYSEEFRAPRIPEPWRRAVIWQHSDGKVGPIKSVPGFGHVDVNAMHPDVPLPALRIRRARRGTGDDIDLIRRDIKAAMTRLDDALKRLPER